MARANKDVDYYRRLPYNRVVERYQENGEVYFVARVAELPWIRIDGDTREEALLNLSGIFDDCIESLVDAGEEIPEPTRWPDTYGTPAADHRSRPQRSVRRSKKGVRFRGVEDVAPFDNPSVDAGRELETAS